MSVGIVILLQTLKVLTTATESDLMAVDTTAKMAELELQTRRTYDAFCPFPISGCSVQLGLGSPDIGRMVSAKRGSSCAIVMNIILTC